MRLAIRAVPNEDGGQRVRTHRVNGGHGHVPHDFRLARLGRDTGQEVHVAGGERESGKAEEYATHGTAPVKGYVNGGVFALARQGRTLPEGGR